MTGLLSDRRRPVVLVAATAALALLFVTWTALHRDRRIGYAGLVRDPARFDGDAVVLSLVRVEEIVDEGRFVVQHGTLELVASGPTTGLAVGAEVTLLGRWEADGPHLEVERIVAAPDRGAKKRLGGIGLLAALVLAPLWFRPTRRGIAIRG